MTIQSVGQQKAGPPQLLATLYEELRREGGKLAREQRRPIAAGARPIPLDLGGRPAADAVNNLRARDLRLEDIIVSVVHDGHLPPARDIDQPANLGTELNAEEDEKRHTSQPVDAFFTLVDRNPLRLNPDCGEGLDIARDPIEMACRIDRTGNIKDAKLARTWRQDSGVIG